MAKNHQTHETAYAPSTDNPSPNDGTEASTCRREMMACGMGRKGFKGGLMMAACCGAPLLILLVLPLVGSVFGRIGISALKTLAFLACPVGMGFMMWMMMRAQRAEIDQPAQTQPGTLDPSTSVGATTQDI